MIERLIQGIRRHTHVVRIFPNAASCLRLVRALAVETREAWLEGTRYRNMEFLREHRDQQQTPIPTRPGDPAHRLAEGPGHNSEKGS